MYVLVISDTHLSPSVDMKDLWKKLGEYCVKFRPEYIVHLGDVADFDSQNWLKASRGLYTVEQELGNVASHLAAFEQELDDYKNLCRKQKIKIYRPKKVLCLGNHDIRNDVSGYISNMFLSADWSIFDYQKPLQIDGISFAHNFTKGLSDNVCLNSLELLDSCHSSVVCGHSHVKDYAESYRIEDGKKIFALKCPMFSTAYPEWSKGLSNKWSRGFTIVNTDSGEFLWKNLESLDV